jgi:isoamylase
MATYMYTTSPGFPQPLGLSYREGGLNFALFSSSAIMVTLCLLNRQTKELISSFPLDPRLNKTGQIWHIQLHSVSADLCYGYQIDEAPTLLLDPYAREVTSPIAWGARQSPHKNPEEAYRPLGALFVEEPFDWQGVLPPRHRVEDLVIYEMHVRGFTCHPSSGVAYPGTFLGVVEKIPELVKLGVNAVELLPLQEFDEQEVKLSHPLTHQLLKNFWGYSTTNFFAPMNRYASQEQPGAATREFKTLVRELHRHGIELILDIVFNHTAEGNREGPILSYKALDKPVYYLLDPDGDYSNYSGCGNTLNANHPVVRRLILDSLHYWALEMRVDGFRFDLASALTRGRRGQPLDPAPLIEMISDDPLLASCKLIAEPWDAAGLYQVGHFWPSSKRWSEWNGKYRDSIRRFIKGSPGVKGEFVTRLCGSEDLYYNRSPSCSINFVTVHDGFTLSDLVSYNDKHNLANGEQNRDGTSQNDSWNCGEEGVTEKETIMLLRERQMRNFHLALMVSQGVPLLLMGDEYGHTKEGNNNSWCQDNELNYFLWDKLAENSAFYRYYSQLIQFRKQHALLRRSRFLTLDDVEWHGLKPRHPDWGSQNPLSNRFIAFTLFDKKEQHDLYIAFNAQEKAVELEIPKPTDNFRWHWVVNTANLPPEDIFEPDKAPELERLEQVMAPFSAIVLTT